MDIANYSGLRPNETDVILTQEDDEGPYHPKNEFVNWNTLNSLLNKELQDEEQNFFVYTD